MPRAKAGDVLQGGPGAPGVITGRARIVLDPMEAPDMELTDIMVAPTTDPAWAPLFLSVGGIVGNRKLYGQGIDADPPDYESGVTFILDWLEEHRDALVAGEADVVVTKPGYGIIAECWMFG